MLVLDTNIERAKKPRLNLPNVVTSFNEEGYKRYGAAFIETWQQYWSPSVRLTVFYEGEDFPFTAGISWRPIEEVEFLTDFMGSLHFPIMHGIVGDHYDINFDARMARKTFIECYAAQRYGGKVFWLDADNITHAHVPEDFLDRMLPDDKMCCYLGRDGWCYTESGFIGFNTDHPLCMRFLKNYRNVFMSGAIFTQPGWHDCYGFDAMRAVVTNEGHVEAFHNLAAGLPHGTMHPLVNSELGRYLDHRKGPRKESRSGAADLVIARDEPYWSQHAA